MPIALPARGWRPYLHQLLGMTGVLFHPQRKLRFFCTAERRETSVGRCVNVKLGIFLSKFLLHGEIWTMPKGRHKEAWMQGRIQKAEVKGCKGL